MPDPELEELALACLAQFEAGGERALAAALARHPRHATRLRGMVDVLLRMGLLVPPAGPAPSSIGPYRLLRQIGEGGMGIVHLAHDERLGRTVALKVMRTALIATASNRERFRREAEVLARLDHPGICTIYEAGDVEGVPYLAMRHLEGESLRQRLERWRNEAAAGTTTAASRRDRVQEALALVEQVAAAVHAAHARGIVHRDLKPDNVVIDRDGRAVVLDFGLAGLIDAAGADLTATRDRLGTPAYMAPEQVRGNAQPDVRTDVYGLGALLYECITLVTPFPGAHREALYLSILNEDVRPPTALAPWAPRDLDAVLLCALAKEPGARYATAHLLAADLARVRTGVPVAASRPGPARRTWRWVRRNRAAAAVIGTIGLALLVSLGLWRVAADANRRHRAFSILRDAEHLADQDALRAYQLARAALALHDEPTLLAATQELLFAVPNARAIGDQGGPLAHVVLAADGEHLLALAPAAPAAVWSRSRGRVATIEGTAGIRAAAARDGAVFAIGGNDGSVRVHDAVSQQTQMFALAAPITDLCFGPAGCLLVAHGMTTGARLWQPQGEPQDIALVGRRHWWCAGFVAADRLVANGALWRRDATTRVAVLGAAGRGHDDVPEDAPGQVAAAGGRFVTASRQRACTWDAEDGAWIGDVTFASGGLRGVDLSPDGLHLLTVEEPGTVSLRQAAAPTELLAQWRTAGARCARFTPDGAGVIVGDDTGRVHSLDRGLRTLRSWAGHRGAVGSIAFAPARPGDFVTVGADGAIRTWSRADIPDLPLRSAPGAMRLAVDVRNARVVAAAAEGATTIADAGGSRIAWSTLPAAGQPAIAADGDVILAASDGTVRWLDAAGVVRRTAQLPDRLLVPPVALADGELLLLTANKRVCRWRADAPAAPDWLPLAAPATAIAATPDGSRIFVGTDSGAVLEPLALTGADDDRFAGPTGAITRLVAGGNGRLAAASADGHGYLWSAATRRLLQRLDGHRGEVLDVDLSPGGSHAVTVCADGTVRVFACGSDTGTMPSAAASTLDLHQTGALAARFATADRVVTAGVDGTVRVWSLTRADFERREPAFGIPALAGDQHR